MKVYACFQFFDVFFHEGNLLLKFTNFFGTVFVNIVLIKYGNNINTIFNLQLSPKESVLNQRSHLQFRPDRIWILINGTYLVIEAQSLIFSSLILNFGVQVRNFEVILPENNNFNFHCRLFWVQDFKIKSKIRENLESLPWYLVKSMDW